MTDPYRLSEKSAMLLQKYTDKCEDALKEIWNIVHTPSRDTSHKHANDHYGADFDKIRSIIKNTLLKGVLEDD